MDKKTFYVYVYIERDPARSSISERGKENADSVYDHPTYAPVKLQPRFRWLCATGSCLAFGFTLVSPTV